MPNKQIEEIDKKIQELNVLKKHLIQQHDKKHDNIKVDKFLHTYSGTRLLTSYTLQEEGVWDVFGEDPNCDLGGTHSMPYLGTFEGKLENVLIVAVDLKGFWQWGAGGEINKKVTTIITKV